MAEDVRKAIEKATLKACEGLRQGNAAAIAAIYARAIDEAKKLIEAGFEFVCTHENLMLFRKRK